VKRRWIVFAVGILVGGLLLWYSLRDQRLDQVWATIRQAYYWWLVPAVIVYFISVWFRAWRWGFLLRASKKVSTNRLFPVVVIGYMGNDVLPFRLGEALRAYVLWRREDINVGTALTTAVLERLFDGITMVLFVLIGLLFVPLPEDLRPWVAVAGLAFAAVLVLFLVLASRPALLLRVAQFLIERLVPSRFRPALARFVEGIVAGLESLRRGRDVVVLFAVTLWVWVLETGKYWLVSFAFPGLQLPYAAILLMGGVVNLATALPSPPGYVGTFEIGIPVLESIGAPESVAGGYVLVLHALLLVPVTALGLILMGREGVRWADVWRPQERSAGLSEG
jgi:uncharacterized protein (TIRG00374 family)